VAGIGPILIFDKSTLQGLNPDESVWLDAFFYPNITPLFFVETLADLEKEVSQGRTPEEIVGNLAEKTPTGGQPNVHHLTLSVNELFGRTVGMEHVPVVSGGVPVETEGKRGLVFEQPREVSALQRWEEGRFLDVEREFAVAWRKMLSGIDLDAVYRKGKDLVARSGRPKDLKMAKAMAVELIEKPRSRSVREALESFPIPEENRRALLKRWKEQDETPISRVAPYTGHVMAVDLFFCLGLGADLISRERPSNKVDIAYLYYLPFCMAFTSNDNLHARTVPLFLTEDQMFIPGAALKADLAKLDGYYSALPAEVKEQGVMSFAHFPPTEGEFLVSTLWDKFMAPGWRENATRPQEPISALVEKDLVDRVKKMRDAPRLRGPRAEFETEEAGAVVFERRVPVRRGKWRLLPPGVEEEASGE
jgi:hypothetical protein